MKCVTVVFCLLCILSVTFSAGDANAFELPFKGIEQQLTDAKCAFTWGSDGDVAYIMVYLHERQKLERFCYKVPSLRKKTIFASYSIRKLNRISHWDLEMSQFRIPIKLFDPPGPI